MARARRFLYQYWEWLAVVPIYIWIFHIQAAYQEPPAIVGLTWVAALLAIRWLWGFAAHLRNRREAQASLAILRQMTPGSSVPPVMYQMQIQANRIDKAVRQEYPDNVERVFLVGGYDGKIDDLEALVILKGEIGRKLSVAFAGDPAGAWMLDEDERQTLLRIRAIIWSYAMAIGNAHFKPPVTFSNAQLTRLPS